MIDVAVRLIAAFLAHETYGLNAMTASLPHKTIAGDDEALPSTVPIYNDADDKGVATAMTPPKLPAIVVWGDSSRHVESGKRDTIEDVTIAIGYLTKDSAADLVQNRTCGYLLRGAKRSLRKYEKVALSDDYRALNGIRITTVTIGQEQRITMAGEGDTPVLWGWLAITARVVDGVQ